MLSIVIVDIILAFIIFNFDFCINNYLNSLYNIKNQAIKFNFKIIIILDCKSLYAKINFFNIILLFNKSIIGCSSFFLLIFFNTFYLSLSSKIS